MTTKHTAGPWLRNQSDIGNITFYAKTTHPGVVRLVGQVFKTTGSEESAARRAEEDASNLSLVLAAPDLLEEAEWALDILTDQYGLTDDCEGIAALRAAIAKARGDA